jgi:NADH-quinone oxidoreductase subunit J
MSDKAELVMFWVMAVPLIAAAAGVVVARSPVYAAMSLVAAFFFLAGIYVLLAAHLIAFLQIIVYAGAIMVLFLVVRAIADSAAPGMRVVGADYGTVRAVGKILFTQYLLPFEATSVLLLVAIVGAVVVAKQRI